MESTKQETALVPIQQTTGGALSVFSPANFESAQRMALALCSSDLVPEPYRGREKLGSALLALDIANRVGASPLMVMQNLHIIEGRPSWSSSYTIAALNSCGRFGPLRFKVTDAGDKSVPYEYWTGPKGQREKKTGAQKLSPDRVCIAYARDRASGEILEGPPVSLEMAVREGWYTKSGSKWQTMPDLMLRYRAAKFFGNLYAPDVLMGMHTEDEVEDIKDITPAPSTPAPTLAQPGAAPATAEPPKQVEGEVIPAKRTRGKKPDANATDATPSDAAPPAATAAPEAQPEQQQAPQLAQPQAQAQGAATLPKDLF